MKTIKDLFSKAISNTNTISELFVEEIKFSKKQNSAIVSIIVDRKIDPVDFFILENKAVELFSLKKFVITTIVKEKEKHIDKEDVERVIEYICLKNDYLRPLLTGIKIAIEENVIIELEMVGAKFLKLKRINKSIEKCLEDFFGVSKKVKITDSEDAKKTHKEEADKKGTHVKIEETIEIKKEIKKTDQSIKENNSEEKTPIIYGKNISKETIVTIDSVTQDDGKACIAGEVISFDKRETRSGKILLMIDVYDKTSTICCKAFLDSKKAAEVLSRLKEGIYIKALGRPQYDMYSKELTIMLNAITEIQNTIIKRMDTAEEKRVELHLHTQMSSMDGINSAKDIVKQAINFGHKAVAITDHGVVQAFPEAYMEAYDYKEKKTKIKVMYGLEGYLISDIAPKYELPDAYVVFDIETTGFVAGTDKITEIAGVKIKNGKIIDEFSTFVNPERPIPKEVQKLTNITKEMVKDAETIETVLPRFNKFCEGSILVAHNAKFDMSFINYFSNKYKLKAPKYTIDTLSIARELFESYKNHKLGTIAENLNIELEDAHRAINDAKATAEIFLKMADILEEKGMHIKGYIQESDKLDHREGSPNHIILFAKNNIGLKNLYKLISISHLNYFYKKPRLQRSLINRYREGLIIGSACERGDLYAAVLKKYSDEEITNIASYYDYLEVQPIGNNMFYVNNGTVESVEKLQEINKKIIEIGERLKIPVVATGDVHFLNKEDEIYRRIIMAGQGYDDADNQAPLYFRTTQEMLDEFKYISEDKRKEIVITNPNKIADMIEEIAPVVSGTFNPRIEGSDEEVEVMTYKRAREIYGDVLPEIVEARIKKELNSIITNGFSVMYLISHKLVKKSNEDGYLVGSRGSVGSSFVATMTGITEVNPLPAHYVCEKCKYSEFPDTVVTTGIDMEDKKCPNCFNDLKKDGMDIPFETFLGFEGDKIPDIDLNFSGDYQGVAHAYTEEMFGKSKTFRAGTISTIADKTAYGYVKKYYDEREKYVLSPEINRLAKGCTGIKRTTGQHPGGIIVVPNDKEIYDFCPVQRPADDMRTKTITTHFDFHSIHDNLLKLDILGHDDPTVIRMLQDLTGVDPKSIPLDEKKVMSLFDSTEALGVEPEQIKSKVGTFAVPEFGTKFVRQMLVDTKPTTFGELVRISGLSHGTDVWLNNAQTLIEEGKATLKEAICTRDDIMIYLMQKGLNPKMAFNIMEIVRKGKAEKALTDEMVEEMRKNNVPEWYIDSCFKIKYMFPKAHAAAYVMMAYRIAYFKVYYAAEFYAVYYTVRADNFSSDIMVTDKKAVKESIKEYERLQHPSQTEKDVLTILEVVNEMLERGIEFLPIDIYKSDAVKFLVEDGNVRPPLSALTGFGTINAKNLVKAREEDGRFSSKENLMLRCKLGKVALEILEKTNCLNGMPNSAQMNLFDN
ncbi:MAG: PolC-type DNA polymerase III [Clostridia bacterium]|nr:PolC-type DNA polymerase III [Clostridia bacterium]MDD4375967.1 PolC-type DNA polymerase III [Clostridia bacterium]